LIIKPIKTSPLVGLVGKTQKSGIKKSLPKGLNSFMKTSERKSWVKQALNAAMEEGQELWREPSEYFRVSGIGDPCIRSMTFSVLGHNVPFEAKTLRIFAVGTAIGEILANTFEKRGILLEAEGKVVHENPPIRGSYDIRIKGEDVDDGEELLGEIKSINDFGFDKLPEEHDYVLASQSPLFESYAGYVQQWNTYTGLLNLDNKVLCRGFILFESKNTQRHKVFFLEFDEELFNETLSKTSHASVYSSKLMVAPIPIERSPYGADPICKRCSHQYLCVLVARDGDELERIQEIDKSVRG
jgi:hypothetical protein